MPLNVSEAGVAVRADYPVKARKIDEPRPPPSNDRAVKIPLAFNETGPPRLVAS